MIVRGKKLNRKNSIGRHSIQYPRQYFLEKFENDKKKTARSFEQPP